VKLRCTEATRRDKQADREATKVICKDNNKYDIRVQGQQRGATSNSEGDTQESNTVH